MIYYFITHPDDLPRPVEIAWPEDAMRAWLNTHAKGLHKRLDRYGLKGKWSKRHSLVLEAWKKENDGIMLTEMPCLDPYSPFEMLKVYALIFPSGSVWKCNEGFGKPLAGPPGEPSGLQIKALTEIGINAIRQWVMAL